MKFKIKGIRHYQSLAVMKKEFGSWVEKMSIGQEIQRGIYLIKRIK